MLTPFLTSAYKITPEEKQLAINGRNWGEAEIDGESSMALNCRFARASGQ